MTIAILPLFKVPQVSASAAKETTLQVILHYVCIGLFLSGLGFIGLGEGQSLRYK